MRISDWSSDVCSSDLGVDLTQEESIARCADLLAGLGRNRDFLADRVIAALAASYADQPEIKRYSAKVFLLHRSPRGFRSEERRVGQASVSKCRFRGSPCY